MKNKLERLCKKVTKLFVKMPLGYLLGKAL